MADEIERKFLLQNDSWRQQVFRTKSIRQGYLVSDEIRSVRVRIADDEAYLNIKSATLGISRSEYEYTIPLADAQELLDNLCRRPLLEKTRHFLHYGDHLWEIDVFQGDNAGLVVAEVELTDAEENFERPVWLGEDVSYDKRYYNACLIDNPYKNWRP
jgi:adenylate cyclase